MKVCGFSGLSGAVKTTPSGGVIHGLQVQRVSVVCDDARHLHE